MLCVVDYSPSGWDNEKKISILYEGLNSMRHDDMYNDVITRPVTRKVICNTMTAACCFIDVCIVIVNVIFQVGFIINLVIIYV